MDTPNKTTSPSKRPVRKNYSHDKADRQLERRRFEAEVRQDEYNALSIKERITRAKARPGNSAREIARLERKLKDSEWQKAQKISANAAAKPAPMTEAQKSAKAVKRAKDAATAVAV